MKTLKYALKNEWYNLILLLIPFLVIPFIWHQLPAQMATHWDLHRNVNGTSSKTVAVFLEPLLNVFLYFLLLYAPQIDPKKFIVIDQKAMPVIRLSLIIFIFCSYAWSMLKALHYQVPPVKWILPAVALLLVVLGNYLRTVHPIILLAYACRGRLKILITGVKRTEWLPIYGWSADYCCLSCFRS